MRARLHVRGGRIGFFREGTHELCDARATRQLLPATCDALERLAAACARWATRPCRPSRCRRTWTPRERVVHLDAIQPPGDLLDGARRYARPYRSDRHAGAERFPATRTFTKRLVVDGRDIVLRRHVLAFFQGNRYLLSSLVSYVAALVAAGDQVIDLYAGAGLFALAAAARGARVVAVEGDRTAAADLQANASVLVGDGRAAASAGGDVRRPAPR